MIKPKGFEDMAIGRDHRFPIRFDEAFPQGLVLVGEVGPDTEFQQDKSRPPVQRVDEATGKRMWKATVTDPNEPKAKRASFEVFFLADVQPVPTTSEVLPGLRPIVLDGLTAQPKVAGQGEFKYLAYTYRAIGFADMQSEGKRSAARGSESPGRAA